MMEEMILEKVREEAASCLGLEKEEVAAGSLLVADLGAESLDLVDLTFRLEKAFNITIPEGTLFEDPARRVETMKIADVVKHVAGLCGASSA